MKWQYKGDWYESTKVPWRSIYIGKVLHMGLLNLLDDYYPNRAKYAVYSKSGELIDNEDIVYIPKYDKCYTIQRFGVMGNGNQVKMCLKDIYSKKTIYVMAKDVELVIKCK